MSNTQENPLRRNTIWLVLQKICQTLFVVWFRYRVRGVENVPSSGAALIVSNHQSFLDPLFIPVRMQRPVSYVARDNLFRVPLIGWILRSTYVIPIDRESPGKSTFKRCIARLEQGFLLGIFPEGTRTSDGSVGKFRPGFLAMLRRCHVPVIPVGIAGADLAMPRGAIFIRPRSIRVVIGAPIEVEQMEGLNDRACEQQLMQMVRQRVVDCQSEAEQWRAS